MGVTEALAKYIAEVDFKAIPASAIWAAKRSMLDTFAVAWAGKAAEGCQEVVDMFVQQGGAAESSIWGHDMRLPAASAALINGLFASALDYDGLHNDGLVHSDIVILPSALAVAERQKCSGRELLTALVVGNDLVCRLGMATMNRSGWFNTSVFGVFGAAAAAAKLQRLDHLGTQNALGLALLNAAGTQQPAIERSLAKRMESAFACHAGVLAGLLAGKGLKGPKLAFEGRFGLYQMYEKGDPEAVIRDLGTRFENERCTLKRYPICGASHAALDGALALINKNDLTPEQIESVEVTLSPYMNRLVGAPFSPQPSATVAGQFSVQYAIASAILHRRLGFRELSPEAVCDPRIGPLASCVRVVVTDQYGDGLVPVDVVIHTKAGHSYSIHTDALRGTPEDPMSENERHAKVAECFEATLPPMTKSEIRAFIEAVNVLEDMGDVNALLDASTRRRRSLSSSSASSIAARP